MPVSLRSWLWINFSIGALSFGGSGRMLLFHEAVVEKRKWMAEEEFFEILTLSQLVPGPNLVNLSVYLSHRLFQRWLAAILGVLALTAPGAIAGVLLVATIDTSGPATAILLQGLSLGSIALFLVFLARLVGSVRVSSRKHSVLGARFALAAAVGCASFQGVPLLYLLLGGIAVAWAMEFLWTS